MHLCFDLCMSVDPQAVAEVQTVAVQVFVPQKLGKQTKITSHARKQFN